MSGLLAGAARRDVTPAGSPRLAGHASRTTASEGIASPLAVRVLAVSDGRRTVLLGVADALWWPPEASDGIRARVARALGLEEAAVILHATHTHSAPQPSTAFAPTLGEPHPAFLLDLEHGLLDAGREALGSLAPCGAFAGTANEAIGMHRRTLLDGRIQMAPNRGVAIDDRVRVVQVRTANNAVIATVVHHACHPTTSGENRISGDYPGALARKLDGDYGGTTLVLQGCAGDVRPALLNDDGSFRLGDEAEAERLGARLATAVKQGLGTASELEPGPVSAHLEQVELSLESGTKVPLRVVSAHLAKGWVLVGLACEPVGRYQQAAPDAWVLGYTNGMAGYLPTARQRLEGGYEPVGSLPHFCLDSPFDAHTESRVVEAITRAAPKPEPTATRSLGTLSPQRNNSPAIVETTMQTKNLLTARTTRLSRRAPVRIVHLGLGAFHRAHQAWYTWKADPDAQWGIAAFTGRSPAAATALGAQDGLYTLIVRSATEDTFQVISSIVEARDGADVARLRDLLSAETTALVTLTITEAGYHLLPDGTLDLQHPAVEADLRTLAETPNGPERTAPTTPIGRLVDGLRARRHATAGKIAVVSCDNLAANATATRNAVQGMAEAADPLLASWILDNVSFVGTSVDRITPRTTKEDLELVREHSTLDDLCPVVTELFTNWILSGSFPSGRPRWEDAGAVFVEDIEPYENRKLWLLNGAHSLLAYAGLQRGHTTVAEALSDPLCARWVQEFWDEAERHLPEEGLDIPAYRLALTERFSNGRISHRLSQIAADGTTKLRLRALPVLRGERAAGRPGTGAIRIIAAWLAWAQNAKEIQDPALDDIRNALLLSGRQRTAALIAAVDSSLAGDTSALDHIEELANSIPA